MKLNYIRNYCKRNESSRVILTNEILSVFLSPFLLSFSRLDRSAEEEAGTERGAGKKTGRGAAVAAVHKDEKREEERGEKGRTTFGRVSSRWP